MEKKNTVLLTVIAVATLLVAVVGATFAYFTATNGTDGDAAGETNVNTASTPADITLSLGKVTPSSNVVYPGTMNYVGSTVAASIPAGETGSYKASYTVNAKVTLGSAFTFPVKYYLYESATEITNPVTCSDVTNIGDATNIKYSQTCNKSALDALSSESLLDSGELTAQGSKEITATGRSVNTGDTKYYYLVVEYPEKNEDQNADAGTKNITAEIVSITSTGSAPINE